MVFEISLIFLNDFNGKGYPCVSTILTMNLYNTLLTCVLILGVFLFTECVEETPVSTPTRTPVPAGKEPVVEPGMVWLTIYNEEGTRNVAYGVAVDSYDNVIVVGRCSLESKYTFRMIKYDAGGNVLWNKIHDRGHTALGVVIDSRDNIIVTGTSSSGRETDYLTVKYDPDGTILWGRSYDGGSYDRAWGVAVDSNDHIIVTGESKGTDYDYCTIKYDTSGNVVWSRKHDGGNDDYAFGVATDSQSNIIVTGVSNDDYYTIKYDFKGDILWERTYDSGQSDFAQGVATDSDDNIIVVGRSKGVYHTIKYAPDSSVLWERSYDVAAVNTPEAIATDSTNNIIIVGASSDTTLQEYVGERSNYCVIKYDSDGRLLWMRAYDGGSKDTAEAVATDSADNVIVTGYSFFDGKWSFLTIKYMGDQPLFLTLYPDVSSFLHVNLF